MSDLPTFRDLFNAGRDEILARDAGITLAVAERDGSEVNLLLAAGAAMGDEVVGQLGADVAALYLDSARGTALDRLVFDRYGLLRKSAAAALGTVRFTTTAANPTPFTIPAGTQLRTVDGRQFVTVAAVVFAAGTTGPVTVGVRSSLAGLSQQARAGTITSIVSQIAGAPADIQVNNTLATAGADDEETDESLRDRARMFFTTSRLGTLAAIHAGALAVAGVRSAAVFETTDALGRPAGAVEVVVSDAFTESLVGVTPTPTAYSTQSQALAAAVSTALDGVRAGGIYVRVVVGRVILQPVVLALTFRAGTNVDATAARARALTSAYMNGLPPGTAFSRAAVARLLATLPGLIVNGEEVVSPSGDVVPQPLEVLRAPLAMVTTLSVLPTFALQASSNPDAVELV